MEDFPDWARVRTASSDTPRRYPSAGNAVTTYVVTVHREFAADVIVNVCGPDSSESRATADRVAVDLVESAVAVAWGTVGDPWVVDSAEPVDVVSRAGAT
jgi:hypothetical protein